MAIRLRDLGRGTGTDDDATYDQLLPTTDGATQPPPGVPARSSRITTTRSYPNVRRTCRLCTALGLYSLVVVVLFTTWSNWRESRPRSMLDVGWQNLQEYHVPPPSSTTLPDDEQGKGENVEGPATPAFPPDRYLPLLPNKLPLVDLEVTVCYMGLACNPPSRHDDPSGLFGPWVKVDRYTDSLLAESNGRINQATLSDPASYTAPISSVLGGTLGKLLGGTKGLSGLLEQKWLWYRRSKVSEDKVPQRIVDVRLVGMGETPPSGNDGWVRVKHDVRSRWMQGIQMNGTKIGSAHLYYRLDTSGTNATHLPSVTELDVIYGPNDPLPGYEYTTIPIIPEKGAMHTIGSRLAVRRVPFVLPEVPTPLTFRPEGTFKVLQLADLHFSLLHQPCRDTDLTKAWTNGTCVGESETTMLMAMWLDTERPDLVVLSGDQLNGQGSTWDERSSIMKFLTPILDRNIPWAAMGGNHDSQSGVLNRDELQWLYRQLPYSKTFAGPVALDDGTPLFGSGNFHLYLHHPTTQLHLASIYLMDSGAHVPLPKDTMTSWKPGWMGPQLDLSLEYTSHYGYVHPSQLRWFERLSSSISPLPDRPPSTQRIERRTRTTSRAKPPAIMFQHIPVPEAFNGTVDTDSQSGAPLIVGERHETAGLDGAQARSGFFDLLRTQSQDGSRDVQVLAHGHMHLNSDCRRIEGVWICFAGGSSLAGYGDPGVLRRARVFTFREWGQKIETYTVYEDRSQDSPTILYQA